MISTSGHTLLPDAAISAITTQLLPHVDWVTPNIPEAQRLVNSTATIATLRDLLQLAEDLRAGIPARVVLLKGGHLSVKREEVKSLQGQYEMIWEEGDEEDEMVEILELYRDYTRVTRARELVVANRGKERSASDGYGCCCGGGAAHDGVVVFLLIAGHECVFYCRIVLVRLCVCLSVCV